MRIAFTGASSTGKTTLANALMKNELFRQKISNLLTIDAQHLMEELGYTCIERMTTQSLQRFRMAYFEKKCSAEQGMDNYLTDRSFVDIALGL